MRRHTRQVCLESLDSRHELCIRIAAGASTSLCAGTSGVLGALTVSGPTVRLRRRELLAVAERWRATADGLSAELGYRVPTELQRRARAQRIPTP